MHFIVNEITSLMNEDQTKNEQLQEEFILNSIDDLIN